MTGEGDRGGKGERENSTRTNFAMGRFSIRFDSLRLASTSRVFLYEYVYSY